MLEYKCELHGVAFEKADKWFPSSQLCSRCGARNRALALATREWRCESCGAVHDRDLNAAISRQFVGGWTWRLRRTGRHRPFGP